MRALPSPPGVAIAIPSGYASSFRETGSLLTPRRERETFALSSDESPSYDFIGLRSSRFGGRWRSMVYCAAVLLLQPSRLCEASSASIDNDACCGAGSQ